MNLISYIVSNIQIAEVSVKNTVELLNEGASIPFIARYRKERTHNLDEVQIGDIVNFKEQFEVLEKRRASILKTLEEQAILTPELKQKFLAAKDLISLEDLYLPFKKSKKTKAETARQNGLEPLAKMIMSQNTQDIEALAKRFVKDSVSSTDDALEGARHIISEWINERSDIRTTIRKQLERSAIMSTSVVKSKATDDNAQKFRDYFDWSESLSRMPSHRFLAILRAQNEGFIKFKVEIDDEKALSTIENRVLTSNNESTNHIKMAIADAYKRLLLPSLSNEALSLAKMNADASAISVFAKNLKQLLLGSPLGEKRILAIDPGFRSGCKIVCLDAQGQLLHNETTYPHAPQNNEIGAIKKIESLSETYQIEAIAIGNGTASRETEAMIRKIRFKTDVQIFVVSEAGASIYSASKIARDEFPNEDVTVRGSVSIGRRLQDPLAELVKIDAKSIGVGQYQHDVDQNQLKSELDRVVESCVNAVGVNLNTASKSLLSYVSGIGPKLAENIVEYREEHGAFKSRTALKKVPRLGDKAFEQCSAFLRVKDAKNPLDNSAVHPESYSIVQAIAQKEDKTVLDLIGNSKLLKDIDLKLYCTKDIGLPTLQDIVKELEKPGLDIRSQAKAFEFNPNIKSIQDIQEGQVLPGIVNNVTNFGAFVDIGIKESGLIHISNLSDTFVSDVNAHVSLHQQVHVKVLEVDIARKRIQLKLEA